MAISQHRMITLINAARDYQRALEEAEQVILSKWRADQQSELLRELRQSIAESALLQHPIQSRLTIEREFDHFRRTAKYNDYQRRKQRERRSAREGAERPTHFLPTTAPQSSPIAREGERALPNSPPEEFRVNSQFTGLREDPTLADEPEGFAPPLPDDLYEPTDEDLARMDTGTVPDEEIQRGLKLQEQLRASGAKSNQQGDK